MQTFTIDKRFEWAGPISEKVCSVMRMFGLDVDTVRENCGRHRCELSLQVGDVCYITGPSGAGKSVILREMFDKSPESERIWLDDIAIEEDSCVVDCIEGSAFDSLRVLSKAGLSDVFTVLNRPVNLSEGQQYRYRLAKALVSGRKVIFADEFCSNLDRITAAIIAYNVRQFAKRNSVTFVLAGVGESFLADLCADVLVVKHLADDAEVIYRDKSRQCHP